MEEINYLYFCIFVKFTISQQNAQFKKILLSKKFPKKLEALKT
jgi:hypothetical protein